MSVRETGGRELGGGEGGGLNNITQERLVVFSSLDSLSDIESTVSGHTKKSRLGDARRWL